MCSVTSHKYSPLLLYANAGQLSEMSSNGNVMCDKYYFIITADSFEVVNTKCEIQTNKKWNEIKKKKPLNV